MGRLKLDPFNINGRNKDYDWLIYLMILLSEIAIYVLLILGPLILSKCKKPKEQIQVSNHPSKFINSVYQDTYMADNVNWTEESRGSIA
jgi:hypothetical protein